MMLMLLSFMLVPSAMGGDCDAGHCQTSMLQMGENRASNSGNLGRPRGACNKDARKYEERSLVAQEGAQLGDWCSTADYVDYGCLHVVGGVDRDECEKRCEEVPWGRCKSFSHSERWRSCHLKRECVDSTSPSGSNPNFKTHYTPGADRTDLSKEGEIERLKQVYNLTDNEFKELQSLFQDVDRDADGFINDQQVATAGNVPDSLKTVVDGACSANFEELCAQYLRQKLAQGDLDKVDRRRRQFEKYDAKGLGDGLMPSRGPHVGCVDFDNFFDDAAAEFHWKPGEESWWDEKAKARELVDTNKDGKINFAEFFDIYEKKCQEYGCGD